MKVLRIMITVLMCTALTACVTVPAQTGTPTEAGVTATDKTVTASPADTATAANPTPTPELMTASPADTATAANPTPTPQPTPTPVQTATSEPITAYDSCVIVTEDDCRDYINQAAERLQKHIVTEYKTTMTTESAFKGASDSLVISVGGTQLSEAVWNGHEAGYIIKREGNILVIRGNNAENTYLAAERFIGELKNPRAADTALNINYDQPSREEYIKDISKFQPVWQYQWQPAPKMLDFEEKLEAMNNVRDGRCLSYAHRGDSIFYPENSIEGIISSVLSGADIVEIDVRMTRDNIMVLMHGDGLDDSTDWAEKKGKTIDGVKLPTSSKVAAWTYEQLSKLRLVMGDGWNKYYYDEVTDYIIPTLDEAMTVCNRRCFAVLDKLTDAYWEDVKASIKRTGATMTFIYAAMYNDREIIGKRMAELLMEFGEAAPSYQSHAWGGDCDKERSFTTKEEYIQLYEKYMHGYPCSILTRNVQALVDYLTDYYNMRD